MKRGTSFQGFLPIRKEPSDTAGMISQVLFRETFTILKSEGPWLHIETETDEKEGWVEAHAIQMLKEDEWKGNDGSADQLMVVAPSVKVMDAANKRQLLLPAGSLLGRHEEGFQKVSHEGWIKPGPSTDPGPIAEGLCSIPGLKGGRCGYGFDAPGLVQLLCRCKGLSLPHSISGLAQSGTMLSFIHEAQKGDLAFFQNGDDQFTHVGMVLDEGRIVHVTDQVRMDSLDQQGIYCVEKEKYTHQLRFVKSVKSAKS